MSSDVLNDTPVIPLNNNTALNEEIVQRWMAGANTRGTADILYTCTITIILCVWTSVHMNVPAPGERPSLRWWRKIKWTCYGLVAPEIVLFTAWSQYNKAKDLIKYLNLQRVRHQKEKTIKTQIEKPFNLRYGFYAIMGGFRTPHPGLEEKSTLMTLSPRALKALAYTGQFIWIDDREVQDRSKADGLAKLLICFQVTWLSVECIARKATNIPLTILEIHTFIHVVCALAIYFVWFKKPLDIIEGSIADLSVEDDENLSFGYLFSLLKEQRTFQIRDTIPEPRASQSNVDPSPGWFTFSANFKLGYDAPSLKAKAEMPSMSTTPFTTLEGGNFKINNHKRLKVNSHAIFGNDEVGLEILVAAHPFSEPDGTMTNLSTYILDWPKDVSLFTRKQAFRAWNRLESDIMSLTRWRRIALRSRAENFVKLSWSRFSLVMEIVILMAYGGVHLTAWNSHFPTKVEMWLWRSSALLLAGTTPLFFSLFIPAFIWVIIGLFSPSLEKLGKKWAEKLGMALFFLLSPIFFAAYVFARCFLVVESFISLRSVPIGVYTAVPWSNWVPHI